MKSSSAYQFLVALFFLTPLLFAQNNQGFKNYNIISTSMQSVDASLRNIATDIESLSIDLSVLLTLQEEKPNFIQFKVIHQSDTLLLKLQRHKVLTEDFILRNQDDEILEYTPGLYYRGKIDGKRESLAVFNFFKESLNGIISEPESGNRIIGQVKNTDHYIIYSDTNMTVSQNFECHVGEIEQTGELVPQNDILNNSNSSTNCVRVFYELTNDIYVENSSSVTDNMNWITSVHNVVATLYTNANVQTALSDVLIWQEIDPYVGENSDKLSFFRENRIVFNGDLAHLLDLPVTGGVAYINSLCQNFRHAFSGLSINYQELPTYSWTIMVIAHEMGHSLGSPHTHACFWNGDNTAIDSCGPENGYSEGCDDGPIPTTGGTVMSYCHLDAVGINLALGFHPQVGSYMSNNIDIKSCLGTDCVNSCTPGIAGVSVNQIDSNSFNVIIDDVISNSWDYRVYEPDDFSPGTFTTISTNSFVYENIQPNTYYIIEVANNCSNGNYGGVFKFVYLADDDWCNDITFTDTGGLNNNYQDNETLVKTFYPSTSGNKIKMTINSFDLELDFDFMTIYDGESTEAPVFADGFNLSGDELPVTFFEATNPEGAITVKFTSDQFVTSPGWDITVGCSVLSTKEFSENDVKIYPNPVDGFLNIVTTQVLDRITIYDINGRILFKKDLNQQFEFKTDFRPFSSGLYLMTLESEGKTLTKRIIKK